jgi:hypothetical protein
MNSSYFKAMHMDNMTNKSENLKRQICHNIREVYIDNVVRVNTKKIYVGDPKLPEIGKKFI